MVLIGSGLMVWVAITANTISAGEQQYFDRDDLYYAECVPVDQRKTYKYYGNESRFIVKGSTRERCAKWSDASFRLRTKVTDRWGTAKAWVYPEEYITHGQCRNFDFTLKDKRGVQHVIMHLKLHSGSYPGPWCYKEKGDLFVPMPCFGPCSKQTRVTPAPKRQLRDQRPRNYNAKIFDDVSTSIFDKYEWGPLNYYVEKPSDSKHSQQFAQNRATIFLMMVSLVVLIIVLVIGFHLVKAVVDQRRKLSIPKVFEQTPKKKLDKSKTVKQCSEPSSNISVDGKRSAPMNTKASSLKDDSHSSSSKQQSPPERETAV